MCFLGGSASHGGTASLIRIQLCLSCLQIFTDPPRLFIKKVQKEDQGMYQCFVSNEWEQVQSTSELQLGGEYISNATARTKSGFAHTY